MALQGVCQLCNTVWAPGWQSHLVFLKRFSQWLICHERSPNYPKRCASYLCPVKDSCMTCSCRNSSKLLRKDPGFIHIRGCCPNFSCTMWCLSPAHVIEQQDHEGKKQPSHRFCLLKGSSVALFSPPPCSRQAAFYFRCQASTWSAIWSPLAQELYPVSFTTLISTLPYSSTST